MTTTNPLRTGELPLDTAAASAAAAASNSSNSASSLKDKELNVDNSDFEEDIKIKQRRHTKQKSNFDQEQSQAQNSNSSSSNNTSSSAPATLEEFIASPVAGIRSVERRTWARLVLFLVMFMAGYLFVHPTAWYRTQFIWSDCVQVPGKGGYMHTICKPQQLGHPFA